MNFFGRGQHKSKHRSDGGFIQVTREELHSPAYKDLSNTARVVLLLIKDDYNPNKKPPYLENAGQTHEDLICTFDKASEYMTREAFSNAILDLVNHGFIEVWQWGTPIKSINFYRQIEMWKYFGTQAFNPQKVIIEGTGRKIKRTYIPSQDFRTAKGKLQSENPYCKNKRNPT